MSEYGELISPPSGSRVLSIQSHVVRGHVGNKSAVFPLQLLGLDVDAINSVQFSNHTGYPNGFKGEVMSGDQLWSLIEGLEANHLITYTHLLTGYIGSKSMLQTVLKVLETLRKHNPDLVYVCDPVLGDAGRLYVSPELVPIYQKEVVQAASILTPNQFEIEQLTGTKITSEADALAACACLHDMGPESIVITSMDIKSDSKSSVDAASRFLTLIGSTRRPQREGAPSRFRIKVPMLPAYFSGTGDLLSALLLGWSTMYPDDLATATSTSVRALQAVIRRTADDAGVQRRSIEGLGNDRSNIGERELKVIQSRDDMLRPPSLASLGIVLEPIE
eukprot:1184679-Prorocentrum_minimum.AAC.5